MKSNYSHITLTGYILVDAAILSFITERAEFVIGSTRAVLLLQSSGIWPHHQFTIWITLTEVLDWGDLTQERHLSCLRAQQPITKELRRLGHWNRKMFAKADRKPLVAFIINDQRHHCAERHCQPPPDIQMSDCPERHCQPPPEIKWETMFLS